MTDSASSAATYRAQPWGIHSSTVTLALRIPCLLWQETGVQVPVWVQVRISVSQLSGLRGCGFGWETQVGMKVLHGKYGVEEAPSFAWKLLACVMLMQVKYNDEDHVLA